MTAGSAPWPSLPYEAWRRTRDTVHAHVQVLGKLAVALAPHEPQLLHAALRLTARGWETRPLPAPDGSGAVVAALDMRTHETVIEHADGRVRRVALTPDRSVGAVTREVLATIGEMVGDVHITMHPQEVEWTAPLDQDEEHVTYDAGQVERYLDAATRAALVLDELRAPYRGRSTQVNAWWGGFDLSISLFSGRAVVPPSDAFIMRHAGDAQQIEVGWWPGDQRHPRAAFFGYAFPVPERFSDGVVTPGAAHWDGQLGEYILDWDDVVASDDPHRAARDFGLSVIAHACKVCAWDPELAASALGVTTPAT